MTSVRVRRLKIPRRPAWNEEQSPEEVDAQERAAFLQWRRALAAVEEAERLVLTPFEKNLEVWRQLWRVVERSHIVVQVGPPAPALTQVLPAAASHAEPVCLALAMALPLHRHQYCLQILCPWHSFRVRVSRSCWVCSDSCVIADVPPQQLYSPAAVLVRERQGI